MGNFVQRHTANEWGSRTPGFADPHLGGWKTRNAVVHPDIGLLFSPRKKWSTKPWKDIDAAAAAASLQSCPALCDPTDSSPPGSPVPWILQARTLEWVAISFSNAWEWKVKVKLLSCVWLRDPMDCSPPGSSTHGIFQARVLELGAIAFSNNEKLGLHKSELLRKRSHTPYLLFPWISYRDSKSFSTTKQFLLCIYILI